MDLQARRIVPALTFLVAVSAVASACDVPVFRYALERWTPDPYEVLVFHRGPLSKARQACLDRLTQSTVEIGGNANLVVRTVDFSGDVPVDFHALWTREKDAAPPWMVLLYPRSHLGRRRVWSGPLNEVSVAAILESPVRTEMADRIVGGQTAVWILIEGGDKAKDDAAEAMLRKELALMPGRLSLPPELVEEVPHLASHLRIEFSVLRIGPTDPSEQVLAAMFLRSEGDLQTTYAGEPAVFPVYGRGRTLFAMVGQGIRPGTILMACRFLVGRCACEFKDENPGVDLLMNYPWKQSLTVSLIDMIELPTPIGQSDKTLGPVRADNDGIGVLILSVGMVIGFILVVISMLVIRTCRKRQS